MPAKLTYDYVKSQFEAKGYTLLSTKYVNSNTKLRCICPKGHKYSITWNGFQQGSKCVTCAGQNPPTYIKVKETFEKEGYTLLSTEYVNSVSKLNYICPSSHTHSTTWRNFNSGCRCPTCHLENNKKEGHPSWKGGVYENNQALYITYEPYLEKYHPVYVVKQEGIELLGVHCIYCDRVFAPTRTSIRSRLDSINGRFKGAHNFYCSTNCKTACPTYGQKMYPKDFKPATSREVQPQLRKLVLKRDDYNCTKCGKTKAQLHCHHIDPVIDNPIESADIDNCITLCKDCHKAVHQLPGCKLIELKC